MSRLNEHLHGLYVGRAKNDKLTTHGGYRPHSGRKPKDPTTTINFRIPVSDKVKLKQLPISKLFKEWYKTLID